MLGFLPASTCKYKGNSLLGLACSVRLSGNPFHLAKWSHLSLSEASLTVKGGEKGHQGCELLGGNIFGLGSDC